MTNIENSALKLVLSCGVSAHKSKLEARSGLSPVCGQGVFTTYSHYVGDMPLVFFLSLFLVVVIMQRTTAKSLEGVNIKSTTCSITLWCWCERFGTVLPVLMEMKLEVEMFCCTSTGWTIAWAWRGPLHLLFQPTVSNSSKERGNPIKN